MKFKITILTILLLMTSSMTSAETNISIVIEGSLLEYTKEYGFPFVDENNRTQVPFRTCMEKFGATVSWDSETSSAIAEKEGIVVKVPIGESYIYRNDILLQTDTISLVKDGRTFLPLKAVMEAFNQEVVWDGETSTVKVRAQMVYEDNPYITSINTMMTINERDISISGFAVNLEDSNLIIDNALAKNIIGSTDSLENIAKDNKAILAINGTYFDAYTDSDIKDPYGILVLDGKVAHNGNDRATIGFKDGKIDIDRVDVKITGSNGPTALYNWYSYWFNRTVNESYDSIIIYDKNRGTETRNTSGTNYIVDNGKVVAIIDNQSVKIPDNGYVVNVYGEFGDIPNRFKIGNISSYETIITPENGNEEFWKNVESATGAGPALVLDGKIDIDLESEHFSERKITTQVSSRSAIGYKKNGTLVVITTTASIQDLAQIMLNLECYEAMNLDGGASSSLWYNGNYIREPGRDISNIIFLKEDD